MNRITISELNKALVKATKSAREKARKNGVAIVYEENEKMIKEYPDGRKTVLVIEDAKEKEIEYK